MRGSLVLILFVFCSSVYSSTPTLSETDVLILNKNNFEEQISSNENVFVMFYAPWCGHCSSLAPDWAKLATKVKTENINAKIAKIDATEGSDLEIATKYKVRGYPTLKFFRSGVILDYDGPRTEDDLYSYVVKKSGPTSKLLSTKEEIESFLSQPKSKLIAYISEETSAEWLSAAGSGQLEEFNIGHVTDSSLFGDMKENSFSIVNEGEDPVTFSGEFKKDDIISFAKNEGLPIVDELAQKIWQRSLSTNTPLVAAFVDSIETDQLKIVKEVAKKYKEKVLFSHSNQFSMAERWGASGKVRPTAVFIKWVNSDPKMTVFNEDDKFNIENVDKFVSESLAGQYKSFKKSEPEPTKLDGSVKVVVGKTFDKVVRDITKDVFIEFFAPWCGHCKKLSPVWGELAEYFKSNKNIVIAKMDVTVNAAPDGIDIKGYPTLLFFPANNKENGIPYSGERELDSLIKFVKDKSSFYKKEEKQEIQEKFEL